MWTLESEHSRQLRACSPQTQPQPQLQPIMSGLGSLGGFSAVSVTLSNSLSDLVWVSAPTSCSR